VQDARERLDTVEEAWAGAGEGRVRVDRPQRYVVRELA
jgi:hypothetical protein